MNHLLLLLRVLLQNLVLGPCKFELSSETVELDAMLAPSPVALVLVNALL